jgi:hypothetical protein
LIYNAAFSRERPDDGSRAQRAPFAKQIHCSSLGLTYQQRASRVKQHTRAMKRTRDDSASGSDSGSEGADETSSGERVAPSTVQNKA